MIAGPSSLLAARTLGAALPHAHAGTAGTAGTAGFAEVLSTADPHLQAAKAAPTPVPGRGPKAPEPPRTPEPAEAPGTPKVPEPPPAHTPGGRAHASPTATKPSAAQRSAGRADSPTQAQSGQPTPEADGSPARLSSPELPTDEGQPAAAAPADTPPSLQALLATLQPANGPADGTANGPENGPATEPAPTLAWGAWASGQTPAGDAPPAGPGAPRGRIHGAPATTSVLPGAAAPAKATTAAPEGLAALTLQAEASAPNTVPTAAADTAASALPGLGFNLPPPSVAASGVMPAASTAPAAQAQIAASPGSAAFAPELGAQISTFVRQGVERAQLQLHPAEMGPVTVQILVEGAAAQVRLWAEQPATRTALEQAMPTLAGQLRESGLTLTGGGVFEQAPQTPEQAWHEALQDKGQAPHAAAPAGAALAAPVRRRGVVDLIA